MKTVARNNLNGAGCGVDLSASYNPSILTVGKDEKLIANHSF
jgi:hypothetical protein